MLPNVAGDFDLIRSHLAKKQDVQGITLAVLMASHPRLGIESPLGRMDPGILAGVARICLPPSIGRAVDAGLVRL